MSRHTISHAGRLFSGAAQFNPVNNAKRGVELTPLFVVDFGAPVASDADGYAQAQAVAGAGNLTLNGALVSGGVGTPDVPRAVQAVSANAGDTTQTLTVTGTDFYDQVVVENIDLNGTTIANGVKAFKTITQIAIDAATAGNVSAGSNGVLGLPVRVGVNGVFQALENDVPVAYGATDFVAGDDTAATATTGDVRGTYAPATLAVQSTLLVKVFDVSSKEGAYGIAQFTG